MWNGPSTSAGTKQRLIRTLIEKVSIDQDDEPSEAILKIHWVGDHHSETRAPRRSTDHYSPDRKADPVRDMHKLGGCLPHTRTLQSRNRPRRRSDERDITNHLTPQCLFSRLAPLPTATYRGPLIKADRSLPWRSQFSNNFEFRALER